MDIPDYCKLHFSQYGDWTHDGNVSFVGNLIYNGESIDAEEVCEVFQSVESESEICDILSKSTGFFAIIVATGDRLFISVDQSGSRKIFYSVVNDQIYISDTYSWVKNQIPSDITVNKTIEDELRCTGYIIGNDTFYSEIKKTQPAELISVDMGDGRLEYSRSQYYRRPSIPNTISSKPRQFKRLNDSLNTVFDNMKLATEDSPLILALSGGYDSRLLAHMLERKGLDDVYLFTHDVQSDESNQAQKVADSLGFDLVKLEYTHNDLNDVYNSRYWKLIEDHVEGYSVPAMELKTLVNLKKIKEHSGLPNNGFIIRGHTIAEAGKRIPSTFMKSNKICNEEIIDDILTRHYTGGLNAPTQEFENSDLRNRVVQWLGTSEVVSQQTGIEKCEEWYWRERIHNHLLCNPSVYDYFEYDFWHPFLERNYLQFYDQTPIEYRYKRRLFESYTDMLDDEKNIIIDTGSAKGVKQKIVDSPFEPIARKIKNILDFVPSGGIGKQKPIQVYETDKRYGFLDKEDFLDRYTGSENHRYFLAEDAIRRHYRN